MVVEVKLLVQIVLFLELVELLRRSLYIKEITLQCQMCVLNHLMNQRSLLSKGGGSSVVCRGYLRLLALFAHLKCISSPFFFQKRGVKILRTDFIVTTGIVDLVQKDLAVELAQGSLN